jgi:capsular polysaccharide biosynthesis protein
LWTVVYIAPSKSRAQKLKNALSKEGLLVSLRGISSNPKSTKAVEVSVPESEVEEAQEIINNILSELDGVLM